MSDVSTVRESVELRRYTSRFYEHIAEAYIAPLEEWQVPAPPPARPPVPPRNVLRKRVHKHSPSMESLSSVSTTSSTLSTSSLNKSFRFPFRLKRPGTVQEELAFMIKGSRRMLRKDDIKVGVLIEGPNRLQQPSWMVL